MAPDEARHRRPDAGQAVERLFLRPEAASGEDRRLKSRRVAGLGVGGLAIALAMSTALTMASRARSGVVSCDIWARPRQATSASNAASAIARA